MTRRDRIAARFKALREQERGGLIAFLEAYDPDGATSLEIMRGLPDAGADLIEIGMPFTDPAADGPIIQRAGQRALRAGATLRKVLDMVAAYRRDDDDTPVVLMGYLNPILSYDPARFCDDAHRAGVDGVIVVDMPPEEIDGLLPHLDRAGLDLIRLVAPTTDDVRLPLVLRGASGFVYYVSIAGITGTGTATVAHLEEAVPRLRRHTDLPIAIGFGIRTPQQVALAARVGDAAVVASALIDTLANSLDEQDRPTAGSVDAVLTQVGTLSAALR